MRQSSKKSARSPWGACAAFALCLTACGGDDGGGTGAAGTGAAVDEASFAVTVQPLFEIGCNCHQSSPPMAPFSLAEEVAYDNLVDAPSTQAKDMVLVAPGSLDDSYLWHKLQGTQLDVGGSGNPMPSNKPFDEDQKAIVERWIEAGAPP